MASPISIYIVPKCGLKIEHDEKKQSYKILKESRAHFKFTDDPDGLLWENFEPIWEGKMSPLSNISLPPNAMVKAGIVQEAKKYAFLFPPPELAERLDWKAHNLDISDHLRSSKTNVLDTNNNMSPTQRMNVGGYSSVVGSNRGGGVGSAADQMLPSQRGTRMSEIIQHALFSKKNISKQFEERTWSLPYFAILGGFVFFDENDQVLAVNTLSIVETECILKLAGPFETLPEIVNSLQTKDRTETLALDLFHEAGFEAFVSLFFVYIM